MKYKINLQPLIKVWLKILSRKLPQSLMKKVWLWEKFSLLLLLKELLSA